jgi:futalosine hydrolase
MSLSVLIVAATEAEAAILEKIPGLSASDQGYYTGNLTIKVLVTGVGSMATSWAMTRWLASNPKPDLAVNVGIAGSFNEDIRIGEVVVPVSDCFADYGIETEDGFLTLGEAGLEDINKFPFRSGKIIADNKYINLAISKLRGVRAISVNTTSGSQPTIEKLIKKYNPDIETLEGATFFYICSGEKIPFLAFRSISNRVEPRNKNNWDIALAIDNLAEKVQEFFLLIKA